MTLFLWITILVTSGVTPSCAGAHSDAVRLAEMLLQEPHAASATRVVLQYRSCTEGAASFGYPMWGWRGWQAVLIDQTLQHGSCPLPTLLCPRMHLGLTPLEQLVEETILPQGEHTGGLRQPYHCTFSNLVHLPCWGYPNLPVFPPTAWLRSL